MNAKALHCLKLAALIAVGAANIGTVGHAAASSEPPVTEGYAQLGSNRIYYRDTGGNGVPVVFMHAGSGNSLLFEKQLAPFTKAGYRVIAYDRAGQGRSTRGATAAVTAGNAAPGAAGAPATNTPELEQLMDYLKIDRFHLVGVAAGGGASVQYTLQRPQRVRSLVIANSIGNVSDPAYAALGNRIRPPAFNQLPLEMRELGPSYRAADEAGVARWLELSRTGQAGPAAADRGGGPAAPGDRAGGPPAAGAAAAAGSGAATGPGGGPAPPGGARAGGPPGGGGPVTFEALSKMTLPVLLLTGDSDLYTPPSVLRMFKEHMPKADFAIIPESGHAAMWENPGEFNRVVLKFLKKH